jgi:anti-sigma factor RsiW
MIRQRSTRITERHLTSEQFGELVARGTTDSRPSEADAHLAQCPSCREELNSTREALALFRQSAAVFAHREFSRAPHGKATGALAWRRSFSPRLLWATAALLVIAGALPLELQRHAAPVSKPSHTTSVAATSSQSDEALLEDINREVSAGVPAPKQALADPTGNA